jgi:membrane fusion protein
MRSSARTTAAEYRKRQLAVLELKQLLSGLSQQIAAKENQLVESRFALSQLPTVMAQKIQALRNDLAGAEQRIAEINGRSAYVIRTPLAGRLTTLQATEPIAAKLSMSRKPSSRARMPVRRSS